MKGLIKRNLLIFFKDKATAFFSLFGALIVLVLYIFFLGDLVAQDVAHLGDQAKPFVFAWVFSGMISITSFTATFAAFASMVSDKMYKTEKDFVSSPLPRMQITFSYWISAIVVGTVMSNLGLKKYLGKLEIDFIEAKVGDRYVLEGMKKNNGSFGGEQSGHLIFLDYNTTGDGILTALVFLRLLQETGKSTEELFKDFIKYPQVLENAKVANKDGWEENNIIQEQIKKYEKVLGSDGRILVRASGTENLIRVMVEGSDQNEINKIALDLKNIILGELS